MKLTICIVVILALFPGSVDSQSSAVQSPSAEPSKTSVLPEHRNAIEQYLESVDKAILTDLPNGKVDRMTRCPWRDAMRRQFQDKGLTGLGIELWSETKPVDNFVRLHLRCNVLGLRQIPIATIEPTLTIPVPERDIRLDWYINTGDESLDERVIAIAKEKAKAFQQGAEGDALGRAP